MDRYTLLRHVYGGLSVSKPIPSVIVDEEEEIKLNEDGLPRYDRHGNIVFSLRERERFAEIDLRTQMRQEEYNRQKQLNDALSGAACAAIAIGIVAAATRTSY